MMGEKVLHVQHYAVIKQKVYELEYIIEEKSYGLYGNTVKKGIKVDCSGFYHKYRYSILKETTKEPINETIVDGLISIPPMKVKETFYHPELNETFTITKVDRGIDGKYYYEVGSKTIDPVSSGEIIEELEKEQEKLIEEYMKSNLPLPKEEVTEQEEINENDIEDVGIGVPTNTSKRKKWTWF